MPFCTPKASDLGLVTHSDTQVHSSTELKRATVSVFLAVGFCFDDEIECMHLNARGKGGWRDRKIGGDLYPVIYPLTTRAAYPKMCTQVNANGTI